MAEFTYYARGDSSTANNASINTQNLSTTPVTELTFFPADGGDVFLEANNGAPDPDTLVRVDGYETTFTVEFTGNLPTGSKYADVNGEDLRGAEITVISVTLESGEVQRFYFVTDRIVSPETMALLPNGATNVDNVNTNPPPVVICFASGTPVDTPLGVRPVEHLAAGDMVSTDLGPRPILWTGCRRVSRREMMREPGLRPVRIAPDALGHGVPTQAIRVSANHRVVVEDAALELAIGGPSALIAAKHLAGWPGIDDALPEDGVTYHHVLLGSHRILTTAGLRSESFDPGPVGMETLTPEARDQVRAVLRATREGAEPDVAMPVLKGYEARALRLGDPVG